MRVIGYPKLAHEMKLTNPVRPNEASSGHLDVHPRRDSLRRAQCRQRPHPSGSAALESRYSSQTRPRKLRARRRLNTVSSTTASTAPTPLDSAGHHSSLLCMHQCGPQRSVWPFRLRLPSRAFTEAPGLMPFLGSPCVGHAREVASYPAPPQAQAPVPCRHRSHLGRYLVCR